jgi:hypothetical protein
MELIEALETVIHTAAELTPSAHNPDLTPEFRKGLKHFWEAVSIVDEYIVTLKRQMET